MRIRLLGFGALAALGACGGGDDGMAPGAPYAVAVVSFEPGDGAGFGQDRLPDVVLGPPRGGGDAMGSLDVLSLGLGGTIVLELGVDAVDGPGPDLIVFENPFRFGGTGPVFAEPGHVAVSANGVTFAEWPCEPDADGSPGCAGVTPVYAHAEENDLDPTDPTVAGGDAFDLADLGMERARFVRIRDSGLDRGFGTDNAGFDLDAVAVVNAR